MFETKLPVVYPVENLADAVQKHFGGENDVGLAASIRQKLLAE